MNSSFPWGKCAAPARVATKPQVIHSTYELKLTNSHLSRYVCVGESTKQQRGDDVPHQTFCSVGGLLNALTGSRRKRALHLSTPPFLHPSRLPSLSLPPDSNSAGKSHGVVPTSHIHYQRTRKGEQGEGRGGPLVLSAGSEGVVTEGRREKEKWKREAEMGVVMRLMCNKPHEGAFREALLWNPLADADNTQHGCELCMTCNLIHIYKKSNPMSR